MRRRTAPLALLGLVAVALGAPIFRGTANAGDARSVKLLVLKEHGVGSAAQAQPYVDKLMAVAQKKQGWTTAKGSYFTERGAASAAIDAEKPQFGILSLAAYLAMKEPRQLETIGQVVVARAGGQQYFLVTKTAQDLAGCKSQKLATDHADDKKFVERVVFAGGLKLADFSLIETKRPLQGLKMVIKDEAVCALIDEAQLAEMRSVDGGAALKSVWSSAKLPPMAVVSFTGTDRGIRDGFKSGLAGLCEGDGKAACGEIGIQSLKPVGEDAYAQILAAYNKDK